MSNLAVYLIFGLGLLLCLPGTFLKKGLFFPVSALCAVAGVLAGLAAGMALEDLLPPLLVLALGSLLPLLRREGGDEL